MKSEPGNDKHEKLPFKGSVLLIDDDEDFLQDLTKLLMDAGLRVVPLTSAIHALRYIDEQRWDWSPGLVICDLAMPRMGGFLFIKRLAELYPKKFIPIVICSWLNSGLDIAEAEIAGASAYLMKPVDMSKVVPTIKKALKDRKITMILNEPSRKLKA